MVQFLHYLWVTPEPNSWSPFLIHSDYMIIIKDLVKDSRSSCHNVYISLLVFFAGLHSRAHILESSMSSHVTNCKRQFFFQENQNIICMKCLRSEGEGIYYWRKFWEMQMSKLIYVIKLCLWSLQVLRAGDMLQCQPSTQCCTKLIITSPDFWFLSPPLLLACITPLPTFCRYKLLTQLA